MTEVRTDSKGKYVVVEKGDTLSAIARKHLGSANKYPQLASLNNISNPNLIYVGQKIYLPGTTPAKETVTTKTVSIKQFGLQSNIEDTLFAVWQWSQHDKTEKYEYRWQYDSGDGVWFIGTDGETKEVQSIYTIPSNAKRVRFIVRPISKQYTDNNKNTKKHFNSEWCEWKYYDVEPDPVPDITSPLEVDTEALKRRKFFVQVTNLPEDIQKVEFEIVAHNHIIVQNGEDSTVLVHTSRAAYYCSVPAGYKYKVRCRGIKGSRHGEWTEYTQEYDTPPMAPARIQKLFAKTPTEVFLDWTPSAHDARDRINATSYTVEYTTYKQYFDVSPDNVQSVTIPVINDNSSKTYISNLASGEEYFFRVRASNDAGDSEWSEIKSIILGKKPTPPTTWSSITTAATGENVFLYWTHNAEDGSRQTAAQLWVDVNGATDIKTFTYGENEDDTGTYMHTIDTDKYTVGAKITWRIRTAGILNNSDGSPAYSDWSVKRTIDIYSKPTVSCWVSESNGNTIDEVNSFPIYVKALGYPTTQQPLSYHVDIISMNTYETDDDLGNPKTVRAGDIVYSKELIPNVGGDRNLYLKLTAGDVDLYNNMRYRVKVTMATDAGLIATDTHELKVRWLIPEYESYEPVADITINKNTFTARIQPRCETGEMVYYKVVRNASTGLYNYVKGDDDKWVTYDYVYGTRYGKSKTSSGRDVYRGTTFTGKTIYYCPVEVRRRITGVTLSVYRREYDGSFTEIATDLPGSQNVMVTDPHPSLDYARYRIVASDNKTGAISYTDIPGIPFDEKCAIVQWEEEWNDFDVSPDEVPDKRPWSGSLLKLPYNLDVTDSNNKDVVLVEYIGREHPVDYHGTHIGDKQSWKVEIPKDDKDTLHALRRLKSWMGSVYVREPSGIGYWAVIDVTYDLKHKSLTIPVTLNITRVEGGK